MAKGSKLITRILNLVYLAGAGVAICGMVFNPLIDINVDITIPAAKVAELMSQQSGDGEQKTPEEPTPIFKVMTREEKSNDTDIMSYLTPEKIEQEVGDLQLSVLVTLPAKDCFDTKNLTVLNDAIKNSLDKTIDGAVDVVLPKVKNLIKSVTKDLAKDIVVEQVKDQIAQYMKAGDDENEIFNEHVDQQKIENIVDNVYGLLDSSDPDKKPTVSDITNAIMGEPDDQGNYSEGVKGILNDLKGVEGFDVDVDSIDSSSIEEAMQTALESIPGLTEQKPKLDEHGQPVIDPSTGEPVMETVVNDLDSAIASILDMLLGGGEEETKDENTEQQKEETESFVKLVLHEEEQPANSEDELEEKVTKMIKDLIPLDVDEMDLSLGGYAPYILLGLIGLGCLPWLLFALVTIIRTIRKRKCWTKPWIIFVFAFLELILGVGLTFFFKFGISKLIPLLTEQLGAEYAGLLGGLTVGFSMSCLWASYVYLAMIPFTIIYMIIAHGAKKEYKQFKKDKKLAKQAQ